MPTTPIRVVVADDHAMIRLAVGAALEGEGFEVVAEAADAAHAIQAVIEHEPDIVLLDVHMPGSGIQACRQMAREAPDSAVVMLTVSDSDDDLADALRAGAVGYLPKDMDLSKLPDALRGVLRGEAAVPRAHVARILHQLREAGRTSRVRVPGRAATALTSREVEVAQLLCARLTTAEIASRLFLSPATVRSHIASILRKLGASSRAEAVRLLEGDTPT